MDADVVVIGSGAGGLTAAVALARQGKRVQVFEQHYLPGGWCHSFPLGGYLFSPGVHYIGELGEGGRARALYEGLGLGADLAFHELNPDGYEHVLFPGEQFDFPRGREALVERLSERFPAERTGVRRFFDTVAAIDRELDEFSEPASAGRLLTLPFHTRHLARWLLSSGADLVGAHVDDPRLRAILLAQCGDHGLPPSRVPAVVHASVMGHYLDGGWYPRGGGRALPRAFIHELHRRGGEIHVETPVARILVENGAAIGVQLADGTEVRAHDVISNADPQVTYGKLLDPAHVSAAIRGKLRKTEWSVASLSLFGATTLDLPGMGFDSGNYWWYDSPDLEAVYGGVGGGFFLTVTTLKDPDRDYGGIHTFEAFTFVDAAAFSEWEGTAFEERPPSYVSEKERLLHGMLASIERLIPDLRANLAFAELGTPMTNRHYCASTNGNLYGTAKILRQLGPFSFQVRSPIRRLWLCGSSTLSHGVLGASTSGLAVARQMLGVTEAELLTGGGEAVRLLTRRFTSPTSDKFVPPAPEAPPPGR